MNLKDQLTETMLGLYHRTGQATGYWANYFRREVKNKGGVAVARRLLQPSRGVSKGFTKLVEVRRADLSLEYVILQEPFPRLFPELAEAQARLRKVPKSAFPQPVPAAEINPETLDSDHLYLEGAVRTVRVNAYERDPNARAACLRYYGLRCIVCGFDFEYTCGHIGRGFIHVHHKRPLSLIRAAARLNPRRDLVPVCPNCHAMLHTRNPPLEIEELRAAMGLTPTPVRT